MSKKPEKPAQKESETPWQTGVIMRKRAHSTGLVDYDYWVYAFAEREPDSTKSFRRGRIWA